MCFGRGKITGLLDVGSTEWRSGELVIVTAVCEDAGEDEDQGGFATATGGEGTSARGDERRLLVAGVSCTWLELAAGEVRMLEPLGGCRLAIRGGTGGLDGGSGRSLGVRMRVLREGIGLEVGLSVSREGVGEDAGMGELPDGVGEGAPLDALWEGVGEDVCLGGMISASSIGDGSPPPSFCSRPGSGRSSMNWSTAAGAKNCAWDDCRVSSVLGPAAGAC